MQDSIGRRPRAWYAKKRLSVLLRTALAMGSGGKTRTRLRKPSGS